jgi:MSHA biogenesis protein MshN
MLKLALQIENLPDEDRSEVSAGAAVPPKPALRAASPVARTSAPASVTAANALPKPPSDRAHTTVSAATAGQAAFIDKRDSQTARERSRNEYRRALRFVNEGRGTEGMEAFTAALAIDPSHEAARRALISLLLDAKRIDAAARLLQEGLALDPSNADFAMLLARILVERNDADGALALLQEHAPAASASAGYHAFVAALYQRLGNHREAVDEYNAALKVSPGTAAWWVGLGISLEAQQRSKDAGDAFRHARDAGMLAPELAAYVDQRLQHLK